MQQISTFSFTFVVFSYWVPMIVERAVTSSMFVYVLMPKLQMMCSKGRTAPLLVLISDKIAVRPFSLNFGPFGH